MKWEKYRIISPPIFLTSKLLSGKSGLETLNNSLLEANIIEFVKQNEGTIFRIHFKRSPISFVYSINYNKSTRIAPIAEKVKLINIVKV